MRTISLGVASCRRFRTVTGTTAVTILAVLSVGKTSYADVPTCVISSAIAAGRFHSLVAATNDQGIAAWGSNDFGQLGDDVPVDRTTPVSPAGTAHGVAVAAGAAHSLALQANGTVLGWGWNAHGQLGDGTATTRSSPVAVQGLAGVTGISAGGGHSLALRGDGTVWAWGNNLHGQLGDGTTTNRTLPVQVANLTGVVAISAGNVHSLAVRGDGTVWAWGNNGEGRLGDGTTTSRSAPVQVTGMSNATGVAAGDLHSLAVLGDGTAWAWGRNARGQLGDGSTTARTTPVQVVGLTGATAVAAGSESSVALRAGEIQTWGSDQTTATPLAGLSGVVKIAAGSYHALALKNDGTVWSWGLNNRGQLGDGTLITSATPVQSACPGQLVPSASAVVTMQCTHFWAKNGSFAIEASAVVSDREAPAVSVELTCTLTDMDGVPSSISSVVAGPVGTAAGVVPAPFRPILLRCVTARVEYSDGARATATQCEDF